MNNPFSDKLPFSILPNTKLCIYIWLRHWHACGPFDRRTIDELACCHVLASRTRRYELLGLWFDALLCSGNKEYIHICLYRTISHLQEHHEYGRRSGEEKAVGCRHWITLFSCGMIPFLLFLPFFPRWSDWSASVNTNAYRYRNNVTSEINREYNVWATKTVFIKLQCSHFYNFFQSSNPSIL